MSDLAQDYENVLAAIRALGTTWAHQRPPTTEEGLHVAVRGATSLAKLAVAAGLDPSEIRALGDRILR